MESSAHCRHTRTVPPLPGPCPAQEGLQGTACPCRTPTDSPNLPRPRTQALAGRSQWPRRGQKYFPLSLVPSRPLSLPLHWLGEFYEVYVSL